MLASLNQVVKQVSVTGITLNHNFLGWNAARVKLANKRFCNTWGKVLQMFVSNSTSFVGIGLNLISRQPTFFVSESNHDGWGSKWSSARREIVARECHDPMVTAKGAGPWAGKFKNPSLGALCKR